MSDERKPLFKARLSRPPEGGMWRVALLQDGLVVWSGRTYTRLGGLCAARRMKRRLLAGNPEGYKEHRV